MPTAAGGRQSTSKDFDEDGSKVHAMTDDKREQLYFTDESWYKNYQTSIVAYLKLYIFADKYSVHQLRDDIMTAMLGQSFYWRWYPDPDLTLIPLVYDNLPVSATFHHFTIYCKARIWLRTEGEHTTSRLRSFREWNEDFAFEVSIALTDIAEKQNSSTSIYICETEDLNSCAFHEHLELNEIVRVVIALRTGPISSR